MSLSSFWDGWAETLRNAIDSLIDRLNQDYTSLDRGVTLLNLTKSLKIFLFGDNSASSSNGFLNYYLNGFKNGTLDVRANYPPEYILSAIFRQAIDDLEVLHHCYYYRGSGIGNYGEFLKAFDYLAYHAVEPAIKARLFNQESKKLVVLTYYQKGLSIRRIPYAPVMLIGVSLTSVFSTPQISASTFTHSSRNRGDLLVIPHEVGHQVFWRAKLKDKLEKKLATIILRCRREHVKSIRLGTQADCSKLLLSDFQRNILIANLPTVKPYTGPVAPYYMNWLEEIFADVYGCMIGGPLMAEFVQEVLTDGTPQMFIQDDGVHPTPILRMEIYIETLRLTIEHANRLSKNNDSNLSPQQRKKVEDWIQKLRDNWYLSKGWILERLKEQKSLAAPTQQIDLESLTLSFHTGETSLFIDAINDIRICVGICFNTLNQRKDKNTGSVIDNLGLGVSQKGYFNVYWEQFWRAQGKLPTGIDPFMVLESIKQLDLNKPYSGWTSKNNSTIPPEGPLGLLQPPYDWLEEFQSIEWTTYGPGNPPNLAPTFR